MFLAALVLKEKIKAEHLFGKFLACISFSFDIYCAFINICWEPIFLWIHSPLNHEIKWSLNWPNKYGSIYIYVLNMLIWWCFSFDFRICSGCYRSISPYCFLCKSELFSLVNVQIRCIKLAPTSFEFLPSSTNLIVWTIGFTKLISSCEHFAITGWE